jgi:hypothetical protein
MYKSYEKSDCCIGSVLPFSKSAGFWLSSNSLPFRSIIHYYWLWPHSSCLSTKGLNVSSKGQESCFDVGGWISNNGICLNSLWLTYCESTSPWDHFPMTSFTGVHWCAWATPYPVCSRRETRGAPNHFMIWCEMRSVTQRWLLWKWRLGPILNELNGGSLG